MKRSNLTSTLAASLAFATLATACAADGQDTDLDLGESQSDVIGGVPAFSPALNAIGSINRRRASGRFTQHCTGTLVTPTVVLTAKHCIDNPEAPITPDQLQFAIGFDSVAPTRTVAVRGFAANRSIDEGGFIGVGIDVAVVHLAEPVTDVPLLRFVGFDNSRVGQRFTMVGYGVQNNDDSPSDPLFSKRLAGTVTLRGPASGRIFEHMFGSLENFLRNADESPDLPTDEAILREMFEQVTLLDGDEAVFGNAPGDAQGCFGDSGGPLIKSVDGKLTIFGVASGTLNNTKQKCGPGGTWAVFSPSSLELIQRESACPLIPAAGNCEGDVAVRCSNPNEGDFRTLRADCSALGQTCGIDATTQTVACVDPA